MLKVLTVTTDYLPNIGGIATHIYNLNKQLSYLGVTTNIMHIIYDPKKKGSYIEKYEGINVYKYYIKKPLKYLNISKKLKIEINDFIKETFKDVDIIHTHELFSTEHLIDVENYKWVWTNHTHDFFELVNSFNLKNMVWRYIEKKQLQKASKIICVSSNVFNNTTSFLNSTNPIYQIPNGIELTKFKNLLQPKKNEIAKKYEISNEKYNIIIVARWIKQKGIHLVVKAMRHLVKNHPNESKKFNFIFVGAGSGNQNYIKEMQNKLTGFDNKIIIDRAEPDEIPYLYSLSNLALTPSIYEPFGIVILEAMASKVLVLAANSYSFDDTISNGNTGFFFEKTNTQNLVSNIIEIANRKESPEFQEIIDTAYNQVVSQYQWQQIAKKTLAQYQQIILV
jgi:glycogen synthase